MERDNLEREEEPKLPPSLWCVSFQMRPVLYLVKAHEADTARQIAAELFRERSGHLFGGRHEDCGCEECAQDPGVGFAIHTHRVVIPRAEGAPEQIEQDWDAFFDGPSPYAHEGEYDGSGRFW